MSITIRRNLHVTETGSFSKSLVIRLCSVELTKRETGSVHSYPMELIRQHSTPSVNSLVYFSKSLATGLPVRRTVAYPRQSDSVWVYWTCMGYVGD